MQDQPNDSIMQDHTNEFYVLIHNIDKRTAIMSSTLESLQKEQEEVKKSGSQRMESLEIRVRSLENWRVYTLAGATVFYFIIDKILPLAVSLSGNG